MTPKMQHFSLNVLTINIHKGFTAFNRRFILPELRDAVDREFFLLSEAHYERYIAPRFLREGMDLRI